MYLLLFILLVVFLFPVIESLIGGKPKDSTTKHTRMDKDGRIRKNFRRSK